MNSFARKTALASIAAIAFAVAGQASATPIVDQSQTNFSGAWSPIDIWLNWTESFTAGHKNSVGGGFELATYPGSAAQGDVTISLYSGPVGAMGTTVLASKTATGTAGSWVDVSWDPVALNLGQTYYLGLTSPSHLYVGYSENNYANGSVYGNTMSYAPAYYDLTFRTYADDGANAASVPEPETVALMLAGLGALGFVTRRRASSRAA